MILTGREIEKQVLGGAIVIDPFRESALNPNSYDLRLGKYLRVYDSDVVDVARRNPTSVVDLPADGLRLVGGGFYLGFSQERVGSEEFVPILHAKWGLGSAGRSI